MKNKNKYSKMPKIDYKTFEDEQIQFRLRNLEETVYKLINLFDMQNKELKELKKLKKLMDLGKIIK